MRKETGQRPSIQGQLSFGMQARPARDALNRPARAEEVAPSPIANSELLCYSTPVKWAPGPPLFLQACRIHLDWGSDSLCGRGAEGTSPRRTTIRGTVRLDRMPLRDKSLKPSGSATVRDDSAMPSLRFITTLLQLHCALLCLLLRLRACKPRNPADTSNNIQSNKGRTGASGAGEEASSSGSRLNRSAPLTACSEVP